MSKWGPNLLKMAQKATAAPTIAAPAPPPVASLPLAQSGHHPAYAPTWNEAPCPTCGGPLTFATNGMGRLVELCRACEPNPRRGTIMVDTTDTITESQLPARLRALRGDRTRLVIAAELGISAVMYSHLETGVKHAGPKTRAALFARYGLIIAKDEDADQLPRRPDSIIRADAPLVKAKVGVRKKRAKPDEDREGVWLSVEDRRGCASGPTPPPANISPLTADRPQPLFFNVRPPGGFSPETLAALRRPCVTDYVAPPPETPPATDPIAIAIGVLEHKRKLLTDAILALNLVQAAVTVEVTVAG